MGTILLLPVTRAEVFPSEVSRSASAILQTRALCLRLHSFTSIQGRLCLFALHILLDASEHLV